MKLATCKKCGFLFLDNSMFGNLQCCEHCQEPPKGYGVTVDAARKG